MDKIARCKACGAEIIFIKTEKGKTTPVNADMIWIDILHGSNVYLLPNGRVVTGSVANADLLDDPDADLLHGYVSHFATCSNAEYFRKRKPRKSDRKKGGQE